MTGNASEILARLRAGEGEQLDKLAELVVDGILGRRIDELVDIDMVLAALDAAYGRKVSSAVIERYLKPAAARESDRARESKEAVNAFLPEAEAALLIDVIRRPVPVDPRIVNDFVQQKAVRSMLGAIIQEAIKGFVTKAPIPGLSIAMDLVGNISRRLDQLVGDFLDQSMTRLTGKLAELALSESGQKLLGEMRAEMAKIALQAPVSFYYDEISKLPTDDLWALLPPVLAHNLSRPEIREAITGEVRAFLARDGEYAAGEFLAELGIKDQVRNLAVRKARDLARHIAADPAFEEWLTGLLG